MKVLILRCAVRVNVLKYGMIVTKLVVPCSVVSLLPHELASSIRCQSLDNAAVVHVPG